MSTKDLIETVEKMSDEDISFITVAHEQHSRDIQTALMMERWHKNDQLSQERSFNSFLAALDKKDAMQTIINNKNTDAMLQMNKNSLDALRSSNETSLTTIENLSNNSLEAIKNSNDKIADLGNNITKTVKDSSAAMINTVEAISIRSESTISNAISNASNIAEESIREQVKLREADQKHATEQMNINSDIEKNRLKAQIKNTKINNQHMLEIAEANKGLGSTIMSSITRIFTTKK